MLYFHLLMDNFSNSILLSSYLMLKVTSHETREKMAYNKPPETDFQQFIRSTRNGNVITPKLQNLVILIVSIAIPEASQCYLL